MNDCIEHVKQMMSRVQGAFHYATPPRHELRVITMLWKEHNSKTLLI
jgi:hypothetical protein